LSIKQRALKCASCGKLVLISDKNSLDEHFAGKHETNLYVPVATQTSQRPVLVGVSWYQQIKMMFIDYPTGVLSYTLIVLGLTLLLSILEKI
jgi:hypothetical protein